MEKLLALPDIKQIFNNIGVEPWYSTPEAHNTWVRDEVNKWSAVAKAIKYVPE
jgi:tripartite-type tricarboxylate transporter receptor subunit TctC